MAAAQRECKVLLFASSYEAYSTVKGGKVDTITVDTQRARQGGERDHLTISDAITASRTDPKIRPYSQILIEKKTRPPPLRSWGLFLLTYRTGEGSYSPWW